MSDQELLFKYAVLVGSSPMIPIPFLDDAVKSYSERAMLTKICERHGFLLSPSEAKAFAEPSNRGCCLGCLYGALLYPLKKLLRKVFLFLEVKRATDLASRTFVMGYLFDHCLGKEWWEPDGTTESCSKLAAQMRQVCDGVGTSPINKVFSSDLDNTKKVLNHAADHLSSLLTGARPDDEAAINQALDEVELEEAEEVEGLVKRLSDTLMRVVPAEYFERLGTEFRRLLDEPDANYPIG